MPVAILLDMTDMTDSRTDQELTPRQRYYRKNRARILTAMNARYKEDPDYREATRDRARRRYHEDPGYREATIARSKARSQRLRDERRAARVQQASTPQQ